MIDVTTNKPLRVWAVGDVPPRIHLPDRQLAEVVELLHRHGIRHTVDEDVISIDDGPFEATIRLTDGADAQAIQAILDGVG